MKREFEPYVVVWSGPGDEIPRLEGQFSRWHYSIWTTWADADPDWACPCVGPSFCQGGVKWKDCSQHGRSESVGRSELHVPLGELASRLFDVEAIRRIAREEVAAAQAGRECCPTCDRPWDDE